MAYWAYWLELSDLYEDYASGRIPIESLAKETAIKLQEKNLPERFQGRVEELTEKFNKVESREAFQETMELLWDLGDTPLRKDNPLKLMWVSTMYPYMVEKITGDPDNPTKYELLDFGFPEGS